ncbi:MAG: Crp/Fnr family transcriptional regulator [Pseudomonadota bacterium]
MKPFANMLPKKLLDQGTTVEFRKGQYIFFRDGPGDSLMVVLSGTVKIWNPTHDGHEVVLGFMRPPHIMGEISCLDGGPRTANATAMTAVELLVLRVSDVLPVVMSDAQALLALTRATCRKARETSQMVEDARKGFKVRIASGLLRLSELLESPRIDIGASQADLAHYVGVSRSNFNRAISEFERNGILRKDAGSIVIVDRKRLVDETSYDW